MWARSCVLSSTITQGYESPRIHEYALHDLLVAVDGRANMLVFVGRQIGVVGVECP